MQPDSYVKFMYILCFWYVLFFCEQLWQWITFKRQNFNPQYFSWWIIKNFTKDLHLISLHLYTRQQQEIDFPTLIFQYCDFFPSTLCIDILTCIILNKHLFQGWCTFSVCVFMFRNIWPYSRISRRGQMVVRDVI